MYSFFKDLNLKVFSFTFHNSLYTQFLFQLTEIRATCKCLGHLSSWTQAKVLQ